MTPNLVDADLTGSVIGAFYEVYNTLGYGFLESVYCEAMLLELGDRRHKTVAQAAVPIFYKSRKLCTHRIDLLVEDRLVLEVKSGPTLPNTAIRQLHNYLKGTRLELGLLLHFGPEPKFYRQLLTQNQNKKEADQ